MQLWDDWASIVWSTTPAHAQWLTSIPAPQFTDALNAVLTAPTSEFEAAIRGEAVTANATSSEGSASGVAADASGQQLYDRGRDTVWLHPATAATGVINAMTRAVETGAAVMAGTQAASATASAGSSASSGGSVDSLSSMLFASHRRALQSDSPAFVPPPTILSSVGQRAAFPLRFQHTNAYVRPRMALVGDAAHLIHPLAGQNLNLGLADADSLVRALADTVHQGGDIGSALHLRAYERDRAFKNLGMMVALDGIKRVFGPALPQLAPVPLPIPGVGPWGSQGYSGHHELLQPFAGPFHAARALGMSILNSSPLLKALASKYAMGMGMGVGGGAA